MIEYYAGIPQSAIKGTRAPFLLNGNISDPLKAKTYITLISGWCGYRRRYDVEFPIEKRLRMGLQLVIFIIAILIFEIKITFAVHDEYWKDRKEIIFFFLAS